MTRIVYDVVCLDRWLCEWTGWDTVTNKPVTRSKLLPEGRIVASHNVRKTSEDHCRKNELMHKKQGRSIRYKVRERSVQP